MKTPEPTHILHIEGTLRVPCTTDSVFKVQVDKDNPDLRYTEIWQGGCGRWRKIHSTWMLNEVVLEPTVKVHLVRR